MNFEKHFVTLLNLRAPTIFSFTHNLLIISLVDFVTFGTFLAMFDNFLESNFHFISLTYNNNFLKIFFI